MKKNRSWLNLALLTLLVAIVWTVVTAVASIRKSTIPADIEKVMTPLNPVINRQIFNTLQERAK